MSEPAVSKSTTIALFIQILTLLLGALAILWGAFCVYGAAFPGPCGDNPGPGLGVIESWVLDVPVGLLLVCIGAFLKKGSPLMRKMCIAGAIFTLSLPPLASFFLNRWHCG